MLLAPVSESTDADVGGWGGSGCLAQVSTPPSRLGGLPVFWAEAASLAQYLSLSVQVTLFFLTSSPDFQTLTRCREFTDDSLIKPTL